jgi:hypothetical protein
LWTTSTVDETGYAPEDDAFDDDDATHPPRLEAKARLSVGRARRSTIAFRRRAAHRGTTMTMIIIES